MDMKQLITFACSLSLIACSSSAGTPTANAFAGGPGDRRVERGGAAPASVEASADKSAGRPASEQSTPSNPIKKVFGGATAREVTLPAGTVLPVDLETSVGSDISRVEQPVTGRLRRGVTVGGVEALPAGTNLDRHMAAAQRPRPGKGGRLIALRFTPVVTPGARQTPVKTATGS